MGQLSSLTDEALEMLGKLVDEMFPQRQLAGAGGETVGKKTYNAKMDGGTGGGPTGLFGRKQILKADSELDGMAVEMRNAFGASRELTLMDTFSDKFVVLTREQADKVGKAFVGANPKASTLANGQTQYLSRNGSYRYRTVKEVPSANTSTGKQINIETLAADGSGWINTHIDVL